MLRASFVLLPRVGLATEARLWAAGCTTWDDYRAGPPVRVRGVDAAGRARHAAVLDAAEAALGAKDANFFARHLPNGEHWRAWADLAADAAYVDIETDGRRDGDAVTVVGVRRRGRLRQFVAGRDLDADAVSDAFEGATSVVTFNGASFDLPLLRAAGVRVPHVPHVDLLHATRRLGLRGGLKKVEVALGLARAEEIQGLGGWEAVLLWNRHLRGDRDALGTLLAYNAADVDNMEPLAAIACERLTAAARAKMQGPVQVALG